MIHLHPHRLLVQQRSSQVREPRLHFDADQRTEERNGNKPPPSYSALCAYQSRYALVKYYESAKVRK